MQEMQEMYFPICEIPKNGTYGGGGAYFGNILRIEVILVTLNFKGIFALKMLVPNICLSLLVYSLVYQKVKVSGLYTRLTQDSEVLLKTLK